MQGFTAVFALFIVPKVDLSSIIIDDCRENVDAFIDEHVLDNSSAVKITVARASGETEEHYKEGGRRFGDTKRED